MVSTANSIKLLDIAHTFDFYRVIEIPTFKKSKTFWLWSNYGCKPLFKMEYKLLARKVNDILPLLKEIVGNIKAEDKKLLTPRQRLNLTILKEEGVV